MTKRLTIFYQNARMIYHQAVCSELQIKQIERHDMPLDYNFPRFSDLRFKLINRLKSQNCSH